MGLFLETALTLFSAARAQRGLCVHVRTRAGTCPVSARALSPCLSLARLQAAASLHQRWARWALGLGFKAAPFWPLEPQVPAAAGRPLAAWPALWVLCGARGKMGLEGRAGDPPWLGETKGHW